MDWFTKTFVDSNAKDGCYGQTNNFSGFCGWSTGGPCGSDADCIRDGCSGEVCRSVSESPVVTTCEWRDCYDVEKYNVACRCVDGRCTWAPRRLDV